jgi:hypothetical protein
MKYLFTLLTFLLFYSASIAQASFQSAASGDWNVPASWTLVSGTSATGYPVTGDDVGIGSAHIITVNANFQCSQLTLNAASQLIFNSNASVLTVTGSVNQSAASTVSITQGAFTVAGLMFITSPTSAGNTLLDVEGGAFSCAGGISITGTTSTRTAELRIGSSLVNIIGGLATITANAKINFTGNGTLTLAGVINISNPTSFTAGNGRVVYVGIPGSDQIVAPLTYNRLVITGLGGGSKKINGAVTVTDTLTLLTDTLAITGGSLALHNNVTIVRTQGKLISTPTFSGQINVVYNNIIKDTTGPEIPVNTATLRDLTINNTGGVTLGANTSVNNTLHLLQGALTTGIFSLNITNGLGGTITDPAIERVNGYVDGSITRNIGTSTGVRIFPLGIGLVQGYREFKVNYTIAPSAAGLLNVSHTNSPAPSQSGLPLTDGALNIINTAPFYWTATAQSGLNGGIYDLTLTAESTPGVMDISALRIIKRSTSGSPWIVNGTAGTNSGSNTAPVVNRTGMSDFSQFTIGSSSVNTLPVSLLYFTGKLTGNSVLLQWATSSEINSESFVIERSVDGRSFTRLQTIAAAVMSGVTQQYEFTDVSLPAGIIYYRLKQTDIDGAYSYSPVVVVHNDKKQVLHFYPSISSSCFFIDTGTTEKIYLYNNNGQFIQLLQKGNNDISHLAAGSYYIKTATSKAGVVIKQ